MKQNLCRRSWVTGVTVGLCLLASSSYADNRTFMLTSVQWNIPRNEQTILQMPALRDLMTAYQQQAPVRILVKYPGGDEGTLWASELRAWLVSLGVASAHIDLVPGSRQADTLELHLIDAK